MLTHISSVCFDIVDNDKVLTHLCDFGAKLVSWKMQAGRFPVQAEKHRNGL